MARTYKRDSRGRFAGGGSSSGGSGGGGKKGGSKSSVAPKKRVKATKANVTKKQKAIEKGISAARQAAIAKDSGPKQRNQAMSKKAEAAFGRTKAGKREKLLAKKNKAQEMNRRESVSTGKGSKARKRAKAMGLKMGRR